MLKYIIHRLLALIPVLFGITLVAFWLGAISPGTPAVEILERQGNEMPTEEEIARVEHSLGLDRPWPARYVEWLGDALHGELGDSYYTKRDIGAELMRRMKLTLELSLFSLAVALILGLGMGYTMAALKDRLWDKLFGFLSAIFLSVPGFWMAMFAIILFGEKLRLLPTSGYDGWKSLILPACVLACSAVGSVARLTRSSMIRELNQYYSLVAAAKGLKERQVLLRHAFRNSLIPVITLVGTFFGSILGGSAIVENIFALPGLGAYALNAITSRDYYVIQGYVLITGCVFVFVSLAVDLIYMALNPKIRLGGKTR